MQGQLREVVHSVNNMAAKVDQLGKEIAATQKLPDDVKDLQKRVSALEAKENQRTGAFGLAKLLPAFVGGLIVWVASLLTGKMGQ